MQVTNNKYFTNNLFPKKAMRVVGQSRSCPLPPAGNNLLTIYSVT